MFRVQSFLFFSRMPLVLVGLILTAVVAGVLLGTPGTEAASYGTVENTKYLQSSTFYPSVPRRRGCPILAH